MKINYGSGKTQYGPGVQIDLTGEEVAIAIMTYLTARRVHIDGPKTITVNGEQCRRGSIYVDPSGSVITKEGKFDGRGE